jgi:hypothetical protein
MSSFMLPSHALFVYSVSLWPYVCLCDVILAVIMCSIDVRSSAIISWPPLCNVSFQQSYNLLQI